MPLFRLTARSAAVLGLLLALASARAQEATESFPPQAPAAPPALVQEPAPPVGVPESLSALLRRVLPHDPQVKVARALLLATTERNTQARSRLAPTASVTVTNGQSLEQEFGSLLDRHTDRAEASLRWNLYNAGNDMAELRATALEQDAARAELRRALEEGVERIADAYLEQVRADSLLPLAQARMAAVQRLVDQVLQQNEAGKASDADALQARASLLDAEIALEQVRSERDSARQKLLRLVGDELRPVLPVSLPEPPDGRAAAVLAGDAGVEQPGLVAAASSRAQAARERVRPVALLAAPRVDLEVRRSLGDSTKPQLTTQQQRAWLLSVRWDLPLGGEAASRRNETERRAEAAEADADRVARGARAELDALGPTLDSTARAVERLDRQITQYSSLVRAGELQFEAGRRSLAQLMQLHDSRFNAQQRRADQQRRFQSAQLRRLALTGSLLPALGLLAPASEP